MLNSEPTGGITSYTPKLPRTFQPKQILRSSAWGDKRLSLASRMFPGLYTLSVRGRAELSQLLTLIHIRLPSYLDHIEPTVILDGPDCPTVRLLFVRRDHPPEVMFLPYSWKDYLRKLRELVRWRLSSSDDKEPVSESDTLANLLERVNRVAKLEESE